jgi:16S rRNA (guanine527-N7)-methyltransferase
MPGHFSPSPVSRERVPSAARRVRVPRPDAPLGPEGFAEVIPVSRETLARLEAYAALLVRWSARINLIGRDTITDLWRRHILDSAQLHALLPAAARSLIDLGSGAGLPGLVLAILGAPGVELVEADSRKCAFLREAARITEVSVAIRGCRIQAVPPHPVNVVTARALAPLDRLLGLAEPFLAPGSECLFLKGERVEDELTLARRHWTMTASLHRSRSDPRGVVLRLQQVVREG